MQNGRVFWSPNFTAILSAPSTGGAPDTVAVNVDFLSDFVVDGSNVYYSEMDAGDIQRIPTGGGTAVPLHSELSGSYYILAQDGSNIYWINQVHVGRVPKTGGTGVYLDGGAIAEDPFFAASIAVDGSKVYWTNPPVQRIGFGGK